MTTILWRFQTTLILFLCATGITLAQTEQQKSLITKDYDQTKLLELQQQFTTKAQADKQYAIQQAQINNWEILKKNSDGTFDELIRVSSEGTPIYWTIFNDDAAVSTRVTHVNTGGSLGLNLDGQNMTAHVWDGGPTRPTHQEFDGPGGSNRVSINDGVFSLNGNSFHAQHVTGTIVASGVQPRAKGMAWQADALTHDWNNDLAEATTEAANGMLVSNHSYGFRASLVPDWYFGAYIAESRDWDNLMYNSPNYLMVVAAGNDGRDNSSNASPLNGNSAFDKLTGHSTSKNNMVVANGQDANIAADGSLNSVLINSGSSEGPTDDLRIKPDITGNGTGLYSTYDNSDAAYNSISGTSMASPNVAGSLLLLQQHYNNLNGSFMRAATLKGIALHTADDAGISGPDAVYGWGLMNTKAAAEAISNDGNESIVSELTLSPGQTYTINVDSDGSSPLMASISWTDPAGTANTGTTNLTTPVLVNDLDIRVTKGGSTFSPYRLTGVNSNSAGDNDVDPFERVDISGASGAYTITVTHKGSLTNGSQNFSLVVTGLTGTPPVCNATTPTGLAASGVTTNSATLSWNAVAGTTYDLRYRQAGTSSWTTNAVSGTSTNVSGLAASTQYQAQVRSKCPGGTNSSYSSTVTFTTAAVGSNACTGGISSFPFNESFESGIGNWIQAGGDDGNWVRDANGTPSNGTGPSSGADGSFYLFLEASTNGSTGQIGNNATAILESPCLDLSGETEANLSFQYHMYGTSIGTLTVQTSDDDGATWTTQWTLSGNQGNTWSSADVNLDAFAGSSVKVRFVGQTGPSWSSDIAIDALSVTAGSGGGGPSCPALNFNDYSINSFATQDANGSNSVGSGGASLTLTNNTWKYIPLNYTVTANTVIEFEFSSTSQGEIHGIAFENDNTLTGSRVFKVHGTQNYGITNFDNYTSGTVTYTIPVGSSYTGNMDRLVFINDNDAGSGNNSTFSNVKIYEGTCGSTNSLNTIFAERVDVMGDEDELSPMDVSIFPVPASGDVLNVKINREDVSYKIISVTGQAMNFGKVANNQVDISGISDGVYMLELVSGTESKLLRFIKK
ncbi:MAG: S8 family serine peptidase [Bacteroidota bacterium]